MKSTSYRIAFAGIWTAVTIGLSYLLAVVPNVEVQLVMAFLISRLIGLRLGLPSAVLAMFIFSSLNPMGIPVIPVFVAQLLGVALSSLLGYLLIAKINDRILLWGVCGFVTTLCFDILTNLATFISFSAKETLIAFIIGGLIFSILHLVSNILIFSIIGPVIYRQLLHLISDR